MMRYSPHGRFTVMALTAKMHTEAFIAVYSGEQVWPIGLMFLKTYSVKQYSYQNNFSGVFDALHQSFIVLYMYQAKPLTCTCTRAKRAPVQASTGYARLHKIVGSPCLKVMHAYLSVTGYTAPVSKDRAGLHGIQGVLTVLAFIKPVNSPGASFDLCNMWSQFLFLYCKLKCSNAQFT